jgi:hypothetical protein
MLRFVGGRLALAQNKKLPEIKANDNLVLDRK